MYLAWIVSNDTFSILIWGWERGFYILSQREQQSRAHANSQDATRKQKGHLGLWSVSVRVWCVTAWEQHGTGLAVPSSPDDWWRRRPPLLLSFSYLVPALPRSVWKLYMWFPFFHRLTYKFSHMCLIWDQSLKLTNIFLFFINHTKPSEHFKSHHLSSWLMCFCFCVF